MPEMKRRKLIPVTLLAIFGLAANIASSAQAISPAPSFSIGGARLVAGKTHAFASHIVKPFVLNIPELGTRIECSALAVEHGVLIGSAEGEPGTATGTAHFTRCALVEGNGSPNCELPEEAIITNPLMSIEVENVLGGGGGKQLLKEVFPASGANFVTLRFTGSGCTVKETAVSGQVTGEIVLDTVAEGAIELGQTTKEATGWRLRFPTVAIKEVWLITNGVGKVAKTKEVTFDDIATQTGVTLTLLATNSGTPVYELWSPLP